MTIPWLRGSALLWAVMVVATAAAKTAAAVPPPALPSPPPSPGIGVDHESGRCTAGFAAQGSDGSYYLMTSGHCDSHDGTEWTYGNDAPLGRISASEHDGDKRDAAIIRLEPSVGMPVGDVGGRYQVRDVLSRQQIQAGMPFCKIGAVTGETCGVVKSINGDVVEASVFSLDGDSGSPGFVMNPDGTVSAVGLLMSSPDGDDYTTYFMLINPLLGKWGLRVLP
ncbi:trypsin [Mycobacterium sp. 852002-51971_SCH5477799-a]|uniref:S1 family peptidase n=1 Tax=Mycobacterium sp. 852002-51971_SCH5477799-a TaxID=1834106 RepID=UPI0007FCCFB2|nr:S1 family peptidase [Mycobacterium sp. 852002-51971_SCH5477799-a]OBF65713.1 trypsin [Mycobacterium sp. 852002-51971_SCH5477799-a]